jgi:hypothetical protein
LIANDNPVEQQLGVSERSGTPSLRFYPMPSTIMGTNMPRDHDEEDDPEPTPKPKKDEGDATAGCMLLLLLGVILFFLVRGCINADPTSAAIFNKITPGMSLTDVEAMMGPGQPVAIEDVQPDLGKAGALLAPGTKVRLWGRDGVIILFFQDDKVIAKLAKGL